MTPFYLDNYKVITVDIDETLVQHGSHDWTVHVDYHGRRVPVAINTKNVELVQKFYNLNYEVIFWSRTGADWSRAVVERIGLADLATGYMTKPLFYVDDRACEEWMGERVFKEPV